MVVATDGQQVYTLCEDVIEVVMGREFFRKISAEGVDLFFSKLDAESQEMKEELQRSQQVAFFRCNNGMLSFHRWGAV